MKKGIVPLLMVLGILVVTGILWLLFQNGGGGVPSPLPPPQPPAPPPEPVCDPNKVVNDAWTSCIGNIWKAEGGCGLRNRIQTNECGGTSIVESIQCNGDLKDAQTSNQIFMRCTSSGWVGYAASYYCPYEISIDGKIYGTTGCYVISAECGGSNSFASGQRSSVYPATAIYCLSKCPPNSNAGVYAADRITYFACRD